MVAARGGDRSRAARSDGGLRLRWREQQDANEPEGDVHGRRSPRREFPRLQGLGETARFSVTVRNPGTETVPNVAVTVDGFANPDAVPGAADPERPIWIVNAGPDRRARPRTSTPGRSVR